MNNRTNNIAMPDFHTKNSLKAYANSMNFSSKRLKRLKNLRYEYLLWFDF